MITALLIVSLVLCIIIVKIIIKQDDENLVKTNCYGDDDLTLEGKMLLICGVSFIVFLIWVAVLIYQVGTGVTISQKISMYEEENARIEESIDTLVKSYMDFEASTYIELKDKDTINLVALFPELNSDTLVQQQIAIYVSNNQKIKELRENQIDLQKARWMLYFGR